MADLNAHHVGIVVDDLDDAVSFYHDALGLDVIDEFTLAGDGIATAIDADGVVGEFAHLDSGGTRLELIEYDPAGSDAHADAINQVGAKHVGFEVDDVESFYDDLPDGADPLSEPQQVDSGATILFFRDPDGNFVEVVEG